jgi:hypothetical protein
VKRRLGGAGDRAGERRHDKGEEDDGTGRGGERRRTAPARGGGLDEEKVVGEEGGLRAARGGGGRGFWRRAKDGREVVGVGRGVWQRAKLGCEGKQRWARGEVEMGAGEVVWLDPADRTRPCPILTLCRGPGYADGSPRHRPLFFFFNLFFI